jgi:probable rRNA maturation factor
MTVRIAGPPAPAPGARVDTGLLRQRARAILKALGHPRSELSLSFVDDAAIAELNEQWRGKRGPTDVLSFSLVGGDWEAHRGRLLGDVVIGVDVAARQARQSHRSLSEELTRLTIHGVLHLLGHDHEHDVDARRMRAEERRLWRVCRT